VHKYVDGRGRERWRVNYELPPHPDGRRRKSTKRGFATKREARVWEDGLRGRIAAGDIPLVREQRQTVAGYLRAWYVGVGGKATTTAHRRNMCEWYLIPHLGGIKLEKLSAEQVDAVYRLLERGGWQRRTAKGKLRDVGPLSPKTVRSAHVALHRALAVAVERGYVSRNVAGLAHPPSERAATSRNSERVWTPEQTGRWLAWLEAKRDRLWPVWRLLATTGLRRGEACGLHWEDVDLESGALRVRWELTEVDNRPVWVDGAKTRAGERTVELDARTVEVLRTHHARLSQEKLACGPAYHDLDLVVCWEDGSVMHPDRLWRALRRHAKALGLPRIDVHALRHGYATMALDAGVDAKVVSERLGHAHVSTTLGTYRHVSDRQHRAAAERIAKRITG
jgi:integrase